MSGALPASRIARLVDAVSAPEAVTKPVRMGIEHEFVSSDRMIRILIMEHGHILPLLCRSVALCAPNVNRTRKIMHSPPMATKFARGDDPFSDFFLITFI